MSKWSQKLDKYLATNKISKKQLASKLGISINTLQKWWGNREPSPAHAVKIQDLLDENISVTTTISDNSLEPVERETEGDGIAASQLPKQGERDKERSVVVSLLRTDLPSAYILRYSTSQDMKIFPKPAIDDSLMLISLLN